ncbi:cytochrome c oxidase subunit 3 [Aliibacillus thermotolerans]|uniref:Cytochrome c oxidase subunit 3 n=1 Tax=Aliibacillus thermotolerans TaxID=1834418 RepID=A0ABW0U2Q9_9BACI|nr:cytochrome c oxidase subunit 3 [Aliibacillus thermotolerans]MDA3131044.1 cytochrome (ubi)quinol oxidase subunit III [Aliibacillus thermotolerans]
MADHVDVSQGLPAEPHRATLEGKNKFLAMWCFLTGETIMFATFFGTFLGLRHQTAGGPALADLVALPLVFFMTMLLLTSSLTSVLGILAMKKNNFKAMRNYFVITVLLGFGFIGCEIYEFYHYYHAGLGYTTSAFASSFYTLVGLHGFHVLFGLGWIITLLSRYWNAGVTLTNAHKFYAASLYWHFIDVIWVFIFTVVYLLAAGGA